MFFSYAINKKTPKGVYLPSNDAWKPVIVTTDPEGQVIAVSECENSVHYFDEQSAGVYTLATPDSFGRKFILP